MSTAFVVSRPSNRLNVALWTSQAVLAAFYAAVGIAKLTQPIPDLAAMMVWPGAAPEWFVRFIGSAELAGALGLLVPSLSRILPVLTMVAAAALVLLQVCAIAFHLSRGEFPMLPFNIVLLAAAAFIAWGRSGPAPISAR